jgi:hypothetical protein
METELRHHSRVRFPDAGYFIHDRTTGVSGPLVDISRFGLAFDYLAADRLVPERLLIDITETPYGRPLIRGLVCKTVYDIRVLSENLAFKRGLEVRRCGLLVLYYRADEI